MRHEQSGKLEPQTSADYLLAPRGCWCFPIWFQYPHRLEGLVNYDITRKLIFFKQFSIFFLGGGGGIEGHEVNVPCAQVMTHTFTCVFLENYPGLIVLDPHYYLLVTRLVT